MKPAVGILGGGQLSLMLSEAAARLEIQTHILIDKETEPVSRLRSNHRAQMHLKSQEEGIFFKNCARILFENEFVNIADLKEKTKNLNLLFIPSLDVIEITQDKLKQKSLFGRLGLASSKQLSWDQSEQSAQSWLQSCDVGFGGRYVLKWSRFGYDGKGNLIVDSNTPIKTKEEFIQLGLTKGARIYAEEFIDFKRELAITATHSLEGDLVTYPLVITEQEAGVCRWVWGPATAMGVSQSLQNQAEEFARIIAKGLQITGTFAIEMFETKDGQLLINEMAPRVHNSTHYSLDFSVCSQFENHMRACVGLELGSTDSTKKFFGMFNLLGQSTHIIKDEPIIDPELGLLKWYGKEQSTSGRKLGHINFFGDSQEELTEKKQRIIEFNKKWLNSIT